jgi:subtilisin family serine protease
MAAPHVAGVVALLLERDSSLDACGIGGTERLVDCS